MLKMIVQHSAKLVTFLSGLKLALYQPQMRHLTQVVDALLVCPGRKTMTNLYRQIIGDPDPKNAADFFRESTWFVKSIVQFQKKPHGIEVAGSSQSLEVEPALDGQYR